ncbi:hypothetical protein [Peterkaempfera griseoplana]|uniref:hypothetical protein n=1 Tax=Peterkaempfera griseoplana TaxID=66896 RepID=UPI0006E32152|nr:hypothetical protein [Peterkaempfera griseoplana]
MREKLTHYIEIPAQVRGFEPGELRGHRAEPSTVFTRRPVPYAARRHELYRQKLSETAPYQASTRYRPAPPDTTCLFKRVDGSREQIRFPETLRLALAPPTLLPVTSRTREPIQLTRGDLQQAASEMDTP